MKNFELKKEIWLWLIMLLPIGYLVMVWNKLPQTVPTHFGIDGKPNDWSDRSALIYITLGMTLGMYLLFLVIPDIDPKKKIKAMGNKYFKLKFALTLCMSVLALLIVHAAVTGGLLGNVIFVVVGALFAFLGNYMQTVRPNYFIGIRTPWALENEEIWDKTHKLAGRLFFISGIAFIVFSFMLSPVIMTPLVVILSLTATIWPAIYSFKLYKQISAKNGNS